MVYVQDERNQEGLCFDPNMLWERVLKLIDLTLVVKKDIEVTGVTVSSQREGIVLVDKSGNPMIGFPNHDFRGRFLEDSIDEKDKVTGWRPVSYCVVFGFLSWQHIEINTLKNGKI